MAGSTLKAKKPMQRGSGFKSKPPERPPRPDRSEEFKSFKAKPTADVKPVAVMARVDAEKPAPAVLKTPEPHDKRIRESARNQECSIRIAGVCNGRTDTTVWCHLPSLAGGRGMGFKSLDINGALGCAACHDVVDGRAPRPPGATQESVMLDFCFGHFRSLIILKQKGLL